MSAPPVDAGSSASSSSSSSFSSSSSSRSSTPPRKSFGFRSLFGMQPPTAPTAAATSHPASSSSSASSSHSASDGDDDGGYGGLPPHAFALYGHLGPHVEVDGLPTRTSNEQLETERRVDQVVQDWKAPPPPSIHRLPPPSLTLLRELHVHFLLRSLDLLPSGYSSLDASRPWLIYWSLQSLSALLYPIPLPLAHRCAAFLALCQHPTGGYGGGPGQYPHLAPTYAAINALTILSGVDGMGAAALTQVDRQALYRFLLRMKQSDGSFSVCDDGECDTRGLYTAISVASLCGLLTADVVDGVVGYLQRCQTFEGGMGGQPGNEAHGGYTFCSLAALMMLNRAREVRLEGPRGVRQWAARRQMRREGGFCGRTNKLVDGCYSFWVGALLPLLDLLLAPTSHSITVGSGYDELAMQRYILLAGQTVTGGLRDKPGKGPDLYHTCYCLSGLSQAQWGRTEGMSESLVAGGEGNRVRRMNPLYNVPIEDAERALEWAAQQDKPDSAWT